MKHFYRKIEGYFDFQDIYRMAAGRAGNGDVLVEVGSWAGRSVAFLAVELVNAGRGARAVAVDLWKGRDDLHERCLAVAGRLPPGLLSVVRADSVEAAASFGDGSLPFVFIDADHSYEAVKRDLEVWAPKVKAGGLLGGHDYVNRSVRARAVNAGVKRAVDGFFPVGAFSRVGNSWLSAKSADGKWGPCP